MILAWPAYFWILKPFGSYMQWPSSIKQVYHFNWNNIKSCHSCHYRFYLFMSIDSIVVRCSFCLVVLSYQYESNTNWKSVNFASISSSGKISDWFDSFRLADIFAGVYPASVAALQSMLQVVESAKTWRRDKHSGAVRLACVASAVRLPPIAFVVVTSIDGHPPCADVASLWRAKPSNLEKPQQSCWSCESSEVCVTGALRTC